MESLNRQIEMLKQAKINGINYLDKQSQEGLYKEDFGLRHGVSTGWSTAYVGRLLKEVDPDRAEKLTEHLLSLQNIDGGWGYNESVPSDSDSTANALILLCNNPKFNSERRKMAIACIQAHQHPNGGISTYTQANVHMMGYQGDGWSSPHMCATALAARFLEGENFIKAVDFLLNHRQEDGVFKSYWWASDLYGILETAKTINCFDPLTINILKTIVPKDCFELALKIQGLIMTGHDASDLVDSLMVLQNSDGSWPDSAILKIPTPDTRPGVVSSDVRVSRDKNHLFTTSNALLALEMYQRISVNYR